MGIVDPQNRAIFDGVDEDIRDPGPNRRAAPAATDQAIVGPILGHVLGAVEHDQALSGVVIDALLEPVEHVADAGVDEGQIAQIARAVAALRTVVGLAEVLDPPLIVCNSVYCYFSNIIKIFLGSFTNSYFTR